MTKIPASCGTKSGYDRHRKNGEQPCEPCMEAMREQARKRYAAGKMRRGTCSQCDKPVSIGGGSSGTITCRDCRQARQAATTTCPACGVLFIPQRARYGLTRTCSVACGSHLRYGITAEESQFTQQLRWHIKNSQRRRNILTDPQRWTLVEIAERDHNTCGLCQKPVDMTLNGLHRYGPTIDHIIPLPLSRDDRRINVRLTHRICNIERGNNAGWARKGPNARSIPIKPLRASA